MKAFAQLCIGLAGKVGLSFHRKQMQQCREIEGPFPHAALSEKASLHFVVDIKDGAVYSPYFLRTLRIL